MKARPPYRAISIIDAVSVNPYVHFLISELWAGLTGVGVYAIFLSGAYATQYITTLLPLQDKAPAIFLQDILGWGASISAAATFVIISAYQLVVLGKRLWESVRDVS
jgi:hypothetical protein